MEWGDGITIGIGTLFNSNYFRVDRDLHVEYVGGDGH